jgi:hypothetical protein
MSAGRTALAVVNAVEKRPWAMAAFLVALYALDVARPAVRPLWYDELLTYHIARSTTWAHFATGILRIDLNPPLQHILTFVALRLFGESPLVTRLPSLACFLIASLCLYRIALRRSGTWYAVVVVLLFWASPWFLLATEARPYGLLIACFVGAFLAWERAVQGRNRTAAVWDLFACVNGMLWSHCFALFLLIPFAIAELARWRQRRKADWTIWMVFAGSCALAFPLYLRLLRNSWAMIEPPRFVTDWFNMVVVYVAVVVRPAVVALLAVSLLVALRPSVRRRVVPEALPGVERFFLGGVFLIPFCLQVMLIRSQGPFWPRYAIGYGFFASLAVGAALYRFARRDVVCAVTAAVALALTVGYDALGPEPTISTRPPYRRAAVDPWYLRVRPELPFVCAGGFTFVGINHRESAEFLGRTYYLTDPETALRAHATIFEGFPFSIPYMGGKGHVEPYREFTREHRRFLVLTTVGYPEDWLLPKLAADGAVLKKLEQRETGYMDQTLFDVTLPAN